MEFLIVISMISVKSHEEIAQCEGLIGFEVNEF
jgi:hypothetical protein